MTNKGECQFSTNGTNMSLSRDTLLHRIRHSNCVSYAKNNLQSMTFLA